MEKNYLIPPGTKKEIKFLLSKQEAIEARKVWSRLHQRIKPTLLIPPNAILTFDFEVEFLKWEWQECSCMCPCAVEDRAPLEAHTETLGSFILVSHCTFFYIHLVQVNMFCYLALLFPFSSDVCWPKLPSDFNYSLHFCFHIGVKIHFQSFGSRSPIKC